MFQVARLLERFSNAIPLPNYRFVYGIRQSLTSTCNCNFLKKVDSLRGKLGIAGRADDCIGDEVCGGDRELDIRDESRASRSELKVAGLRERRTGDQAVFFIDAEDQRVLRRIEMETDDIFQLSGELRIITDLEALDAVRLQSVGPPDAAHAGFGNACFTRHPAARPLRSVPQKALCGPGHNIGNLRGGNRWWAAWPRRILQLPGHALRQQPALPPRSHQWRHRQTLCDLLVLKPRSSQQHDTAVLGHAHRSRPPPHQPV
jgi:hypothetical protein